MLKILKQRAEIAQAQGDFERRFETARQRTKIRAGRKGETHELDGFWIPDQGIWVGFKILPNRYWNAFGIGLQASNSISCEINFPIEGKNERVAGVFAEDEQGAVWVLHRGKIGGGKKGISKALFEKRYKGRWLSADGDPFAVVGNLGQADFAKNVADFVRFVDEMKHSVSTEGRERSWPFCFCPYLSSSRLTQRVHGGKLSFNEGPRGSPDACRRRVVIIENQGQSSPIQASNEEGARDDSGKRQRRYRTGNVEQYFEAGRT